VGQSDDIEELLGKVWGGRYQIQEFVGRGGMGIVFKARHLQMDRDVALKVIHRKLCQDEKQVQRFEQEARTSSKLHHPNSIRVYDYGTSDDGRLYMAMEFLSGITLGKMISEEGAQPPKRVLHIARQIIKSLSEAHELGLVHRDLKPENIIICDIYGEHDFVKVLDFGIAKAIGSSEEQMNLTQTGFICGTPRYLSPEQALGHDVDGRADLYSVGVLMYEMLTGRPPFIGENPISIVMKHVHDDPPPLTGMEKYGDVGRQARWLVERLLEKNPARRPFPGERIVEFIDGRIDESTLMGRPVASLGSQGGARATTVGHPDRADPRDFAEEAGETMPPVSSSAKTIPPATPTTPTAEEDDGYHTAVLGNTTQPPGPPPSTPTVPSSDETAMIQRPEALIEGETRPTDAAALDDGADDTRILSLEQIASLTPPSPPRGPGSGPRIRRSGEGSSRREEKGRPPKTRKEAAAPRNVRGSQPRDPLWAWVATGLAVAIFILSGAAYLWAPPASVDPNVAGLDGEKPAPAEIVRSKPAAPATVVEEAPRAVEPPKAAVLEVQPAAAEPKTPPIPDVTGQVVGAALAAIKIPESVPTPPDPEPAPPPKAPPEAPPETAVMAEPAPAVAPSEPATQAATPREAPTQAKAEAPAAKPAEALETKGWLVPLVEAAKAQAAASVEKDAAAAKKRASAAPKPAVRKARPVRRTQRKQRPRPQKKKTDPFEPF
jgi:serine/threonine protein kinase